jgi:hypothetical protein
MPDVRGYQIECGNGCQSCLPRGFARSSGSSSASTVTVWRPEGSSAAVMSAENDVWPPSCDVTKRPFTHTCAR